MVTPLLRNYICLFMCAFFCMTMKAQQFSVASFRLLTNDISAYISPVRDLNDEACALIKVVGNADFVFSTPLGIVQRKDEVGEIWVYVPHGTVLLTIKHPQWGVLRDYMFQEPLESRLTYELVLNVPQSVIETSKEIIYKRKDVRFGTRTSMLGRNMGKLPYLSNKWNVPWNYLLMADVGFHKYGPLFGLRLGMLKRHGFYLSLGSNAFSMPAMVGECDEMGKVVGKEDAAYYTGEVKDGRWKVLVGGIHRLSGKISLYEGIGYGESNVAWKTSNGDYLRNISYSTQGISAELGGIYQIGDMVFQTGIITINAKQWEVSFGVGIVLK